MKNGLQSSRHVVRIRRLPHAQGLPLPSYQTAGSAGLDLIAALPDDAPLVLEPSASALAPTGLEIALPPGYEAQVRPRSGLAAKHGVTVLNSPGTIDSDYRGEVRVLLINLGRKAVTLARGDRIAQLIVAPVSRVVLVEVEKLQSTRRGGGGFGSTGRGAEPRSPGKKRKSVAGKKPAAKARTQKRPTRAKR